ncbi:hypothetical protein N7501_007146 [Penicillium viridicatum]|nr:hypothetical protein N7501_007146 [Penicillium viridicatum]
MAKLRAKCEGYHARTIVPDPFGPAASDRKKYMSPMKRAFRAESVDIRFDDFKSAGTGYREIYIIRLGGDQRLRKKGKKHQPSSFSDYLGAQKEHELDTWKWVLENSNVEQGGQRQGVMLLEPHNVTASLLKVNTVRDDLGLRCIV